MAVTEPGRVEVELADHLRTAVLDELRLRDLDAAKLAQRLDLVPTSVRALLGRDRWPLRAALALVEGLELPIEVHVNRSPQAS
jgi:hypothetical protein